MPFCLIPFLAVAWIVGAVVLTAIQKARGKTDRKWF